MHKVGKYNEVYSVLKVCYSLGCHSFLRNFLSVCVFVSVNIIHGILLSLLLVTSAENSLISHRYRNYVRFTEIWRYAPVYRVFSLTLLYCNSKGSDERLQSILTVLCTVLKKKKVDGI